MVFCQILSTEQAADQLAAATDWAYSDCVELVEYLGEYFEDLGLGELREFDAVAIRCDWSYYETREEAATDWGLDSFDELEDNTTVFFPSCGGVFVEAF
jgi:hypothetical protein